MARWTDLATWVGPTINEGDGDGRPGETDDRLTEVRGLVLHIASGFYQGTIAWQRNASADVSSHFIVARDGRCAQMVDTDDRAWTQRSGNSRWLSVELEGFAIGDKLHAKHPGWERLTDAQIEACARFLARIHRVYGVPLQLATSPSGRGLGHHSMGYESGIDWGHRLCPGEPIKAQKPQILARAVALAGGAPDPEGDDVMYVQVGDAIYAVGPAGPVHVTWAEWVASGWERGGGPRVLKLQDGTRLALFRPAAPVAAAVDVPALAAALAGQLGVDQAAVVAALESAPGQAALVRAANEAEDR
jgi:hypothetical protein